MAAQHGCALARPELPMCVVTHVARTRKKAGKRNAQLPDHTHKRSKVPLACSCAHHLPSRSKSRLQHENGDINSAQQRLRDRAIERVDVDLDNVDAPVLNWRRNHGAKLARANIYVGKLIYA